MLQSQSCHKWMCRLPITRAACIKHRKTSVVVHNVSSAAASPAQIQRQVPTRARIKTGSGCELAVSIYPTFKYDAAGGGGWGTVKDLGNSEVAITFNPSTLIIPDVCFRTSSIFNVPLPPFLNIEITPLRLEGTFNLLTGVINLQFDADFYFTAFSPLYKAPPLIVRTLLTTEGVQSGKGMRTAVGKRATNNAATLVGVATVPPVNDWFLDSFLMAPTDVLAVMTCEFEFE